VSGIPASADEDLAWLRSAEGAWCVPSTWDPAGLRAGNDLDHPLDEDYVHLARLMAGDLSRAARDKDVVPLTSYLAVIAQDADHMGERLAEFPDGVAPVTWHQGVSAALVSAARSQRAAIERAGSYGRVIYAGGDDLLALSPVATALTCAREANAAFREAVSGQLPEATASAAVVYFHASWPLQSAIAAARALLDDAKARFSNRHGLGIAVLRRGGERSRLIVPWLDPDDPRMPMLDHVQALAESMAGTQSGLSARLASELERDRQALASLDPEWVTRELLRRSSRHGGSEGAERALLALSYENPRGGRELPGEAVLVASFLAGEAVTVSSKAPAASGEGAA
jgi:CRISPR-associated protein Cmr2